MIYIYIYIYQYPSIYAKTATIPRKERWPRSAKLAIATGGGSGATGIWDGIYEASRKRIQQPTG